MGSCFDGVCRSARMNLLWPQTDSTWFCYSAISSRSDVKTCKFSMLNALMDVLFLER